MAIAVLLLLGLFWSLVCCQTFPYVSFRGQTLANHSYANLSQVGRSDFGGDWYFPDGTRLPFPATDIDTYEARVAQRVDLRRYLGTNSSTVGIYRCDIPTNAVHHYPDISVRDTVYVGLYTGSGGMQEMHSGVLMKRLSLLN